MLMAVDVGNTQTVLGLYEGDELRGQWRLATEAQRTSDELVALGFPVLVGASRKSFLGRITGVEEARDRVLGTVAANVIAYEKGATLFRVHDVRANREALAVARAILDA